MRLVSYSRSLASQCCWHSQSGAEIAFHRLSVIYQGMDNQLGFQELLCRAWHTFGDAINTRHYQGKKMKITKRSLLKFCQTQNTQITQSNLPRSSSPSKLSSTLFHHLFNHGPPSSALRTRLPGEDGEPTIHIQV